MPPGPTSHVYRINPVCVPVSSNHSCSFSELSCQLFRDPTPPSRSIYSSAHRHTQCAYIYIYIYVYVCICICTCICTCVCICIGAGIGICMYMSTVTNTVISIISIYIYIYIYLYLYTCVVPYVITVYVHFIYNCLSRYRIRPMHCGPQQVR